MKKKEADFEQQVLEVLAVRQCKVVKLEKPNWPDRLVVPDKWNMFFIEFKRDKKGAYKQTEGQKRMQKAIEDRGHKYLLLDQEDPWELMLEKLT